MWGTVYAIEPDLLLGEAGRGPNRDPIRHRPSHHDYWCLFYLDTIVSVPDVVCRENMKAEEFFLKKCRRTDVFVANACSAFSRLLELLPRVEGDRVIELGDQVLSLDSKQSFIRFHNPDSLRNCYSVLNFEESRRSSARSAVCQLVDGIRRARIVSRQFDRQFLHGRGGSVVHRILKFLGRAAFLPSDRPGCTFIYKEVEAPATVTQHVEHAEEPADIAPDVAAERAEEQWAEHVHRRCRELAFGQAGAPESSTERVFLVSFSRHPEALRKALCEGVPLQQCRAALEDARCHWQLGSGAKVFVHPWQYKDALVAVVERGIELRPFHVIVAETLESSVEASLTDIPCRQGARVRSRGVLGEVPTEPRVARPEAGGAGETSSPTGGGGSWQDVDIPLAESRTFLCAVPRLRNPESVTQSTTEAHNGGVNPRRLQAPSSSS